MPMLPNPEFGNNALGEQREHLQLLLKRLDGT